MGRTRRFGTSSFAVIVITTVVLVGASASTLGATALHARTLPKGPRIDPAEPCTLLGQHQVEKYFEPKVILDKTNAGSPLNVDCAWDVGDTGAPVGRLVAVVVYPAFGGDASNAVNIVESDRANAQIAGPGVVDFPLGKGGFIEKPISLVEVAPNKTFAFSLQWFAAGGPPEGSPITPEAQALLTTFARDIAKRGKRVR
jgi:hypothetical protein